MGMLRRLSQRGDDVVRWDVKRAELGEADAVAAVAEAERIFAEARQRGATAYAVGLGQTPTLIEQFDPQLDEIVLAPRVVGG